MVNSKKSIIFSNLLKKPAKSQVGGMEDLGTMQAYLMSEIETIELHSTTSLHHKYL